MLKLLPLAPSIESFKKSGDHYKNTYNSESVGTTNNPEYLSRLKLACFFKQAKISLLIQTG